MTVIYLISAFLIAGLFFAILAGIFGMLFLGFWLWMLVDCIARKNFPDKVLWILVLFFGSFIGSVLYYFMVKRK